MKKKTKKTVEKKELLIKIKKEYKALVDEEPFNTEKALAFNKKYYKYKLGKKLDIEITKLTIKVLRRVIKTIAKEIGEKEKKEAKKTK